MILANARLPDGRLADGTLMFCGTLAARGSVRPTSAFALEPLELDELLPQLAARLARLFGVEAAEVQVSGEHDEPRADAIHHHAPAERGNAHRDEVERHRG